MNLYEKSAISLARYLYYVAGIAIVAMMLLTCADVILRLFRKPILGTYELVCYLSVVGASFAMPHTSLKMGHVAVSFVVDIFPKRIRGIIESITGLVGISLFAVLAWRSFRYALSLKAGGEVSQTIQLHFYPFVFGIGFAAIGVCLVLLVGLGRNLRKGVGK